MRFEMRMPDLATTESEIRIVRWIVQPGQQVERGEPLLEVETDKAAREVESAVSGVLAEVRSQVDESVSVGEVIAVLEVDEATAAASSFPPARPTTSGSPAVGASAVAASPAYSPDGSTPQGMFARNRAAAAVLSQLTAGRSLSVAERTAAKHLHGSKQTVPHSDRCAGGQDGRAEFRENPPRRGAISRRRSGSPMRPPRST